MNTTINHISFEDSLWIKFSEELISFGHKGLPSDVHFTISFDPRNEDINFHITRNVSNQLNKPKITIACIHKELFKELQARWRLRSFINYLCRWISVSGAGNMVKI